MYKKCHFIYTPFVACKQTQESIHVGMRPRPPDFGMGSWGLPAKEYEAKTLFKVVTFQKCKDLCILN